MTLQKLLGSESGTEIAKLINAIIDEKASVDLDNLSQTAQALIDEKIEADALAAQNGYIKFKLNGISNPIIIQWGVLIPILNTPEYQITFPQAFSSQNYSVFNNYEATTYVSCSYYLSYLFNLDNPKKLPGSCILRFPHYATAQSMTIIKWMAIGY